jgi:AcrR family transcriptional regulator
MATDGDASRDVQVEGRRVAEVQRVPSAGTDSRPRRIDTSPWDLILDAVVEVVAEHGVAGASVELAIARAGVSHRTFYELFDGLDECLVAVLDGALQRAAPLVVGAFAQEGAWWEGMRAALVAMLVFFESEPELAQVCLVEVQAAGALVREHRERIFEAFRALVVERIESEVSHASPLAAEGLHASVIGIVNARLIAPERAPLVELLGPLMGVILGPFMDEAGVAREIERGNELARELLAGRGEQGSPGRSGGSERSGRPQRRGRSADVVPAARPDPGPGEVSVQDARVGVVVRLRARREELVAAIFARMRGDEFDRAGDGSLRRRGRG